MADIVDRLNRLSDALIGLNLDMKLPPNSIDPREAADEIKRLRAALIECGRAAGAHLADDVSTDFLMHVPGEVRAKLSANRDEDGK